MAHGVRIPAYAEDTAEEYVTRQHLVASLELGLPGNTSTQYRPRYRYPPSDATAATAVWILKNAIAAGQRQRTVGVACQGYDTDMIEVTSYLRTVSAWTGERPRNRRFPRRSLDNLTDESGYVGRTM
ncbi:hypothetical protein C8039_20155 [Halogeometricum sp. wsp3]|nr:hypothetical protein C8039_20155 [Halogeometricum sp. wsp3]